MSILPSLLSGEDVANQVYLFVHNEHIRNYPRYKEWIKTHGDAIEEMYYIVTQNFQSHVPFFEYLWLQYKSTDEYDMDCSEKEEDF